MVGRRLYCYMVILVALMSTALGLMGEEASLNSYIMFSREAAEALLGPRGQTPRGHMPRPN